MAKICIDFKGVCKTLVKWGGAVCKPRVGEVGAPQNLKGATFEKSQKWGGGHSFECPPTAPPSLENPD